MAELIRVLHNRPVDEAAAIVDALVERESPLVVWRVGETLRVLDAKLSMKDKALILLHASSGQLKDRDMIDFVEHSNASVFRRDVLRPAHKAKLIEYNETEGVVTISPLGIAHVDELVTSRRASN